jgi:NAD(P)-dependent dehydrogenase (short-subunit alcohol dehydrogenase family)
VSGRLDGQHILLTGGGSGIGRAVALSYVEHGARVTVLERSPESARALAYSTGPALDVVVGDALDLDVLADAVANAAGDAGLGNLTCCVGVFDYYASLRSLSAQDLASAAEEIYRVNVLGTLTAIQAALPDLQRAHGSVTLTLSESAFHPVGGGVLYGSSKWALRGVVSHLAKDLAPEVRVNAVAPGGTTGTRFGGLSTLGQTRTADQVEGREERIATGTLLGVAPRPEDHAGAYVYLADCAAARVTTGVVINSDGGRKP